jgi:hypothetical protein
MRETERPSDAPILQYATPHTRRGRPIFAVFVGILGIAAGLFGSYMLESVPLLTFEDLPCDRITRTQG